MLVDDCCCCVSLHGHHSSGEEVCDSERCKRCCVVWHDTRCLFDLQIAWVGWWDMMLVVDTEQQLLAHSAPIEWSLLLLLLLSQNSQPVLLAVLGAALSDTHSRTSDRGPQ